MSAVTLSEFSALTERESVYWYFGGALRKASRSAALFVFSPFLLVAVFLLAQTLPYRLRKILDEVGPKLAHVTERPVLSFLRDLLSLTLVVARFYNHFCIVSRSAMADVIDELDETVDSLKFSLDNWDDMQAFVKECSKKSVPELPLFAQA